MTGIIAMNPNYFSNYDVSHLISEEEMFSMYVHCLKIYTTVNIYYYRMFF